MHHLVCGQLGDPCHVRKFRQTLTLIIICCVECGEVEGITWPKCFPDTAHVLRDMPVKTSLPKIEVTKVSVDTKVEQEYLYRSSDSF